MKRSRSGSQLVVIVVVVGLVLAAAAVALTSGKWLGKTEVAAVEGSKVQRGPLRISVIERGNLKAADSVSLKSEIEGSATILFLIPEGTQVAEGQLVCELDATALIDRRFQQEISVRNAEAAYVKSRQNHEIQKSQNDSDIKRAEQELYFADTDLRKFREGERKAQEDQADEEIKLAEEEYARATEKLTWSEKLFAKGFLTATELEADKLSLSRAQIGLDQKRRDKDLLVRFQIPRDESALVAGLDEARRELERVKLQADARIVDFDADMRTNEAKISLEKEKLQKLETQIAKAKLRAPRAGMVVYAQEEGGMRYGNSQQMKEGAQVRERQDIITIPSASGMIAQASLHESVLKQVQIGQSCVVKVDALGGREFQGRVGFVAVLPDQNSWFANPNARLYRTEVQIQNGHPDMRPGMSCSIEVLVEDIPDTLYVPVQCVFRDGDETVAFAARGGSFEPRRVEVGRYNDRWVQILSGLEEGETVAMNSPADFVPKAPSETSVGAMPVGDSPTASHGSGPRADAAQPAGNAPAAPFEGERGGSERRGRPEGEGAQAGGGEPGGGRGPMTDEQRARMDEMRKRFESMTPEERQRAMDEWKKQRGGGGERGSPGGTSPQQ